VPAGSSDRNSSSRSSSVSTASALVSCVAESIDRGQQQGSVDLRRSHEWVGKALRPLSPAVEASGRAGSRSPSTRGKPVRELVPSYNGQVLPRELAMLLGQQGQHTF
jgi:hypothetical protein